MTNGTLKRPYVANVVGNSCFKSSGPRVLLVSHVTNGVPNGGLDSHFVGYGPSR